MARFQKKLLHGVPQHDLPAGAHLLEVRKVAYSGPKGISVRVRYWGGGRAAYVLWYSWREAEHPSFAKGQWLIAHGNLGPGRYGDPVVLYVDWFEHWQDEPILEYL